MSQNHHTEPAAGWETFAGIVFALGGLAHIVWGIGAIGTKPYLTANGVVGGRLSQWGYFAVLWGVISLVAAVLLFLRQPVAKKAGLGIASFGVLFWLMVLAVMPLYAIVGIALDVTVIYGLAMTSHR